MKITETIDSVSVMIYVLYDTTSASRPVTLFFVDSNNATLRCVQVYVVSEYDQFAKAAAGLEEHGPPQMVYGRLEKPVPVPEAVLASQAPVFGRAKTGTLSHLSGSDIRKRLEAMAYPGAKQFQAAEREVCARVRAFDSLCARVTV